MEIIWHCGGNLDQTLRLGDIWPPLVSVANLEVQHTLSVRCCKLDALCSCEKQQ
jgi:hypothetical protein